MKKIFYIACIMIFLIINSCSKTYEDYNVAIDISYTIVVNNETWNIDRFVMRSVTNISQGDTTNYEHIEFEAYDRTYPYPKQLAGYFYFDPLQENTKITASPTENGAIDQVVLNEIDLSYENVLYRFAIDKTAVFPPTLVIYEYDQQRNLISGSMEGALYDKNDPETKRNIKIIFQNIRVR